MVGDMISGTVFKMSLAKVAINIMNVRGRQYRSAKQQQCQTPDKASDKAFAKAFGDWGYSHWRLRLIY